MPIKPAIPRLNSKDFSLLSPTAQIDMLRCQDAQQKSRLLIDAVNGAELLAQLPVQELYLLVMERGPESMSELLSMANAEQWTGFIDLDCWDGDAFLAEKARRWLAILVDNDETTICNVLRLMNFEQLTLILKAEIEILSGPEKIEDDDARAEAVKRDGGYEISYRTEAAAKLYGTLFDILQRHETEFFIYLLEAVRSESLSMIEESVYQQRSGRLLDMGIPDPFEAQKVYAWLDPDLIKIEHPVKVAPGSFADSAPGFPLTLARPRGLLAAVFAKGLSEESAWELTSVVNKVMIADRIEMGDVGALSAVISKVDAYLNLALEWLAGDHKDVAEKCLQEYYLENLFRIGYSLILRLHRRANLLSKTRIAPYLDRGAQACIAALIENPPQYFEGVGDPTRGGTRLFSGLREIEAVEQRLTRVEIQRQLFEEGLLFDLPEPADLVLRGCQPETAEDLTLVEFFLTSLANRLLGRDFQPLPIAEEELAGLHGMVSESGRVNTRLREESRNWLESLVEGGGAFADECMDVWEEEFCAVGFEDVDPRFIGGLIVRLAEYP